MADLAFYRSTIKKILNDFVKLVLSSSPASDVDTLGIFDEANDLYMVYRVGWQKNYRVSDVSICLRIIDGKIWLEEDWTQEEVAQQLFDAGIPKEYVCFGFHEPFLREPSTTAVA